LESFAITVILVLTLYVIINEFVRTSARIPGIKGPTGYPLIGNIWDIRTNAADKYRSWSKKYGGVYQIQLGNIPVVVVNTSAAAKTIFGHNAQALSSRPEFYTFHKVNMT
jgi:3-hydroxyphenylacetate 6-hydroxylase